MVRAPSRFTIMAVTFSRSRRDEIGTRICIGPGLTELALWGFQWFGQSLYSTGKSAERAAATKEF